MYELKDLDKLIETNYSIAQKFFQDLNQNYTALDSENKVALTKFIDSLSSIMESRGSYQKYFKTNSL